MIRVKAQLSEPMEQWLNEIAGTRAKDWFVVSEIPLNLNERGELIHSIHFPYSNADAATLFKLTWG